jgi:hypothetical protein
MIHVVYCDEAVNVVHFVVCCRLLLPKEIELIISCSWMAVRILRVGCMRSVGQLDR